MLGAEVETEDTETGLRFREGSVVWDLDLPEDADFALLASGIGILAVLSDSPGVIRAREIVRESDAAGVLLAGRILRRVLGGCALRSTDR